MGRPSGALRGMLAGVTALLLACAMERAASAAPSVSLAAIKAEISLHDFDAAAAALERAAREGDPEAEYLLGVFYLEGLDGPANSALAREWLEKAATQGNARAAFSLSVLLRQMAPADGRDAQHWLTRARELGYHPTQTAASRADGARALEDANLAAQALWRAAE
ncbi:MAG TPA: hypothetical protein VJ738_13660, partial [Steroidobacteraceae bacterium]|nr:hypothetical protein [Steroidobacteraceae bacterium]